jgi:hypothetical protein
MAKPRTNEDAIAYWADSILEREPRPSIEVNSIIVDLNVVYSFGRHYPMGVIERRANGTVKRVLLTSDHYPSRGFANTPGDQSDVARHAVNRCAQRDIPILYVPLSAYSSDGMIQCRPKPDDPEPTGEREFSVPRRFTRADPGPEPEWEKTSDCIAGTRTAVGSMEQVYVRSDDVRPSDQIIERDNDDTYEIRRCQRPTRARSVLAYIDRTLEPFNHIHVMRWSVKVTDWGRKYEWGANVKKQCPHCAAFDSRYSDWHRAMYGGWGFGRHGFAAYWSNLARYDGWDGWFRAWREDQKIVKANRAEHEAWRARNFIPFSALPTKRGVPRLDADGFPLRKDSEAYFQRERERARRERQARRDHERRERERRQVERFIKSYRRRRRPTFEQIAGDVAQTIQTILTPTHELESNDV